MSFFSPQSRGGRLLALAGTLCCWSNMAQAQSPQFVPFEVIVKFRPGSEGAAPNKQRLELGSTRIERSKDLGAGASLVRMASAGKSVFTGTYAARQTQDFIDALKKRPDVVYAHPNYVGQLSATPNDELYPLQWNATAIGLAEAWDVTTGSPNVRILIVDSGANEHPDLQGRFAGRVNFAGTALEDRGDWRHGTHVAGIIGASGNNGIGTAGVCWGCSLFSGQFTDDAGGFGLTLARTIESIRWAINNRMQVVNMSFEIRIPCAQIDGLQEAVSDAVASGVNLVAAAGNGAGGPGQISDGVNAANISPASCVGAISVAATQPNNSLARYSNFGAVTLAAPGGADLLNAEYGEALTLRDGSSCAADPTGGFPPTPTFRGVPSTWQVSPVAGNGFCYRRLSGTSMSAPHVRTLLTQTASPVALCPGGCGAGLLNAAAAVSSARFRSTGACSTTAPGQPCTFDALGHYTEPSGRFVETVFAGGQRWTLDAWGQAAGPATQLRSVPGYRDGPCQGLAPDQPCHIDTHTSIDYPGIGFIESVTTAGKYWNLDAQGQLFPGASGDLAAVERYANGPCRFAGGGLCRFDTRNLFIYPGIGFLESITAYGRLWEFDLSGNPIGQPGQLLTDIARFR
jgi:hypothetical protein